MSVKSQKKLNEVRIKNFDVIVKNYKLPTSKLSKMVKGLKDSTVRRYQNYIIALVNGTTAKFDKMPLNLKNACTSINIKTQSNWVATVNGEDFNYSSKANLIDSIKNLKNVKSIKVFITIK